MEGIVTELAKMNQRDWFDIGTVVIPIILSFVIIIQNILYANRTSALQKMIHNREWAQQYHENILLLYNTKYEFIDIINSSGFSNNVRIGNVNMTLGWMGNLQTLRINISRRKDLAKLLFEKKNKDLYSVIKICFENEITIIDKYIMYIMSGRLSVVSENAWNMVCQGMPAFKYNYQWLFQNGNIYDSFMKLCRSEELVEIERLMEENEKLYEYEKFDKYFEEYFSVEKIS